VRSITVLRHKPGRRCVIQYDVRIRHDDRARTKAIVIGKIRARRFGNEGYRLLDAIWNAGFQNDSADGVSVPEPLGVIPRLQMWLQRKVQGTLASELLPTPKGVSLARRIAEAIHKVHRAGVPIDRSHTIADELAILHECLPTLCLQNPEWATRIGAILAACDKLGARLPPSKPCGIHRDFYPAQVIVDRGRLHLIDFDLYCLGDPALDVGNFIGHVTEQSLRGFGDPGALREQEQAMEERFVDLSGETTRSAVRAYTTFTLVRHIYLSTQFAERAAFTERLMELCEQRLQLR
jgi:tRNA A-37 threonylcarbamoyl transferase component Bud32